MLIDNDGELFLCQKLLQCLPIRLIETSQTINLFYQHNVTICSIADQPHKLRPVQRRPRLILHIETGNLMAMLSSKTNQQLSCPLSILFHSRCT